MLEIFNLGNAGQYRAAEQELCQPELVEGFGICVSCFDKLNMTILEIKLTKQKRLGEIQEELVRYQQSPQGKQQVVRRL